MVNCFINLYKILPVSLTGAETENFLMKSKKSPKQIAALVCVALLILLYVATLIISLLDFPGKSHLFSACLVATIGLPILLWIFIALYGKLTSKSTIADLFPKQPMDSDQNNSQKETDSQDSPSK